MKKLLFSIYLISFSLLALAGIDTNKVKLITYPSDPANVQHYILENGLNVYLTVNKKAPKIQTYIAVRTGSKNDPADHTGLAHYLEHLLFKGTSEFGTKGYHAEKAYLDRIENLYEIYALQKDSLSRKQVYKMIDSFSYMASKISIANEYDKLMSGIGATGTNAYTSFDETVYVNAIPSNSVEKWIKIEADRFRDPVFRLFHTELEAVYEEKNISMDDDYNLGFEALFKALFPNHPYGTQTTIGTVEHLKNPSIKAIKDYFKKYYVPNNMAIIMSGDFDPKEVIELINDQFGTWLSSPQALNGPAIPVQDLEKRVVTVQGPKPAMLMMAFPFNNPRNTDENLKLKLIDLLLSNSVAGLIDLNIVKSQKALYAGSFYFPLRDFNCHIFQAMPLEGQSLQDLEKLIWEQIDKIKKGDFDENNLKAILLNEKVNQTKLFESNQGRADALVKAFVLEIDWYTYTDFSKLENITKQELVDFANKYYTENHAVVYKEVGPLKPEQKVDKPQITPVELNRGTESGYVKNILRRSVPPISPQFVDLDTSVKQMDLGKRKFSYLKNNENDLFTIAFVFPMGRLNNLKLNEAAAILPYLKTSSKSNAQINQEFFALAINWSFTVNEKQSILKIEGPSKNLKEALVLIEHLFTQISIDDEVLKQHVGNVLKEREDAKLDKGIIFQEALSSYLKYGANNPFTYKISAKDLNKLSVKEMENEIKQLFSFEHEIWYYGPQNSEEITTIVNPFFDNKKYKKAKKAKEFKIAKTKGEVLFLNRDMVQAEVMWVKNNGKADFKVSANSRVFNEYFGGSMAGVVFQTIRESKALAYSTSSRFVLPSEKGDIAFSMAYVGTQADKLNDAVKSMNELLQASVNDAKLIEAAISAVKQQVASTRVNGFETFAYLDRIKKQGWDMDPNWFIYNECSRISLGDIANFQTQFMNGTYSLAIMGSKEKLDMEFVKSLGKLKELSLEDIFGY